MTIADLEIESGGNYLTTARRRVSGPVGAARKGAARLVARVPQAFEVAREGASRLVARVPQAVDAARTGAGATTGALQKLPDSTLRSLAAGSVGVGAGLYLAGRRRMAVAAGVAPALLMSAAISLRPAKRVAAAKRTS